MGETSAQDTRLLDTAIGGNRSGEALSRATNGLLSPEEAVLRLKQLLTEDNILDAMEERRLFFIKARRFLVKAEEDWDNGVKNSARMALDALKFAAEFAKGEAELDQAKQGVTSAYAERMVAAIEATLRLVGKELAARHEIEMEEVEGIFSASLPAAIDLMESESA
jgi:hypothetical protein